MTEDDAAVLREALIRETAGLLVIAGMLWYLGPGKDFLSGLMHRMRIMMGVRSDRIDTEVAQFRAQMSRWDHEQAAQKDRKPASGGGCGCG